MAGKYRLDAVLGSGGMGTVFAAENVDLGRQVAIKVLHQHLAGDEELARRLRQEARAAAAIGHPGIVDVLDLGTTETGAPFIVMERLDGEALGARLGQGRSLPPAIAVGFLVKAFEALAAAHGKGIIHRDLKPDNIFLVMQPLAGVKLVDFGISKQVSSELTLTTSNVVMGTPLYMSPEQARGARDVTPATDLYSMGAILYQALAGSPPHTAANYNEMLARILLHEPLPLATLVPTLPRELTDLVHELLAKDPEKRPSAHDTANRLRTIARLLDTSNVAFSPTLQPANISDEELAAPATPSQALDQTLPTTTAERDVPAAAAAAALGETVASIPPVNLPPSPSAQMLATPAPNPSHMLETPAPVASQSSRMPATTPASSSISVPATPLNPDPARSSPRALIAIVLVIALGIVVGIVVTRGSTNQPAADAPVAIPPVDAAELAGAVDTARPAPDAALDPDATPPADTARDAGRITDARAEPRKDAGAATVPKPDAAIVSPDAGTGMEVDPTNPIDARAP